MPQRSARAAVRLPGLRDAVFDGVEEGGVLSVRLGTTCSLPPRPWSRAAATSRTHVGSPVADVDVGYRPADDLLAEARRRAEAVGLLGREITVDGAALLLPLVGRAGARDVDLEADAGAAERVDPFVGLVRVDEVDDGFFDCDVDPRLGRRSSARGPDSAAVAGSTSSARAGFWAEMPGRVGKIVGSHEAANLGAALGGREGRGGFIGDGGAGERGTTPRRGSAGGPRARRPRRGPPRRGPRASGGTRGHRRTGCPRGSGR